MNVALATNCATVTPANSISATTSGTSWTFTDTIATAGTTYKVCLQAVGGTDSVQQTNSISDVAAVAATSATLFTAITPASVTVDLPTVFTLTGSGKHQPIKN